MQYTTQTPETPAGETRSSEKKSSIGLPAAIVTAAAIIGVAILVAFGPKGNSPAAAPSAATPQGQETTSVPADVAKLRAEDPVRGNPSADVLVIEYSDSDCPFCARFHETMQTTMTNYGDKVAWAYRYFPLDSLHPNARAEALTLACAYELGGNSAFWPYLDQIMGVTLSPNEKSNEALFTFAGQQGINTASMKTCVARASTDDRVQKGADEAQAIGAKGTPFSIAVNQKTGEQIVIPGAVDAAYLKQVIDSLL
ncbi:DsbA family protein [Candidatus Nomurabacteria bacterium]|nr:DsbA family protein [Candidatus Nomurabacteria bacterium]